MSQLADLLTAVKTALARIDGIGAYHNTLNAAQIQELKTTRSGEVVESGVVIATRPAAIVAIEGGEDTQVETIGQFLKPITFRIDFLLAGTITETDIAHAIDDVYRAIGEEWRANEGLGVGATEPVLSEERFDQEGAPFLDGVRIRFGCKYPILMEDPDVGG